LGLDSLLRDVAEPGREDVPWPTVAAILTIARFCRPSSELHIETTWYRGTALEDLLSEGCYLLRTNLQETDPAVPWKRYIQLTEAEWAFRITKNELKIRPIWHQKTDRVLAHILVCFLAYVLWKTLGQWMQRAGLGDAPRTLLEELSKIKSGDVVLPTRTKDRLYRQALQWNGSPALRDRAGRSPKSSARPSWNPAAASPSENQRVCTNVVETLTKNRT
jgi:hypothetical protein